MVSRPCPHRTDALRWRTSGARRPDVDRSERTRTRADFQACRRRAVSGRCIGMMQFRATTIFVLGLLGAGLALALRIDTQTREGIAVPPPKPADTAKTRQRKVIAAGRWLN